MTHDSHQDQRLDSIIQAEPDSDDDLAQVAALQRAQSVPVISTVKEAKAWIAKPETEKTGWVDLSMTLLSMRKFARGWFLNLVDRKRSVKFPTAKAELESLPFSIRKNYMVSISLYLIPFNSKDAQPVPDVAFTEGSILHCVHVTGFSIQNHTGIPKGNVSGLDRITEEHRVADRPPPQQDGVVAIQDTGTTNLRSHPATAAEGAGITATQGKAKEGRNRDPSKTEPPSTNKQVNPQTVTTCANIAHVASATTKAPLTTNLAGSKRPAQSQEPKQNKRKTGDGGGK